LTRSGNSRRARRWVAAFTLIEVLAVAAILAVVSTLILPNIGAMRARTFRHQAQELAAVLELARQRAVVTGIPHRLLIDLEGGAYRLEWLEHEVDDATTAEPARVEYDVRGATPLPLAAPQSRREGFVPVPGRIGDFHFLEHDLLFAGIDTPEGWIERGDTYVAFDRDGTGDYTEIVIDDDSGRQIALEIQPLADAVRIRDVEI